MRVPQDWTEHEFEDVFRRLRLKTYQIPTSHYEATGKWPIVDQGKRPIAGYTSRDNPCDQHPFIVFGDHTCEVKFVDFQCFLGADGTQPLATTAVCDLKFGFQILGQVRLPALGYSRHFKELQETVFALPPLPEQRKIADILTTWDEALTQLDALIEAQERRKKALMQQLLTGRRRLKGFSKPWKRFRFSELLQPQDRYVEFDDDHTYSLVSIRRRSGGVFFREALQGGDIKTKVMKRVHTGDFLISRMQVVHGALGMVRPECDGMYASDSYDVLVARNENILHMPFLDWMSRMRSFWHIAYISSHGVHIEKMTFKLSDFMHEKITLPSALEEQRQIAALLDTTDQQLTLLRTQRAALDQQKRGLMQRLLTGKLRVEP